MQDLMTVLKERRSIRNYEDKDVADDKLQTILEAVQWSPSWANTQCWEVVVIKDDAVKEKVLEAVPSANPASKSITRAPVLLALCAKLGTSGYFKEQVTTKFGDWYMFDLGIASQSICLAAHAVGLGTVIVGLFDHDKAKAAINVPEGYELVALIPVGYPSKVPSAPKRKAPEAFTHKDTF
ncbi:MAG: nitroreductase family protein [Desulfobacterales bacterium]|nr:nitroreductase family protein [Desulfobacterales bacterium]